MFNPILTGFRYVNVSTVMYIEYNNTKVFNVMSVWDISYHLELDTSGVGATCRSIYLTTCAYGRSSCVFG